MRSSRVSVGKALCALVLASATPLSLPASQAAAAEGTQPGPPHVSTGGAGHVSGTSATLRGSINPRTLPTTYHFEYGPTAGYGAQTPTASLPAGSTAVKVHQSVTGLKSGYHYRLVATNADGTRDGHDRTFIPKTKKPKVKPGFQLPKTFAPTPFGGSFILGGTLTGAENANRPIVLQASPYPYSRPFADVGAPITTSPAGRFSFLVTKLAVATKFRIRTLSGALLYSPIVPEQVAVRVTLRARSSRTGLVRLYGTVRPAEAGARVFFQLQKPAGAKKAPLAEKPSKLEKPGKGESERSEEREEAPKFSTRFRAVVKRGTRAISRFSAVVRIRDSGRYRAFVQPRPGPLAAGHSPSILLHAARSQKKRKRA
jgi:hypothetical protein